MVIKTVHILMQEREQSLARAPRRMPIVMKPTIRDIFIKQVNDLRKLCARGNG